MKNYLIFYLSTIFTNLIAQPSPYPCVKIDRDESYVEVGFIDSYKDLDNVDFISNLKKKLALQISSYVESSTTITSSNSLRNLRGKKNTNSVSNMVTNSVLNNPLISVCGSSPELYVTMSVTKKEYSKNVNTFFERKLKFASGSLSGLLKLGNIDNKKIYKEKLGFYKNEMSQITSLIPVVELNNEIEDLLDRFDRDLSMLENQYVVWKKNRLNKLKRIPKNIVDEIKKI